MNFDSLTKVWNKTKLPSLPVILDCHKFVFDFTDYNTVYNEAL